MKHFRYRGKRIRPADKDLLFRSACCVAILIFLAVFALLNLKTILQTDWRRLSMLDIGVHWNVPYLLFSGIVSAAIAAAVLVLLYRLFPDTVRQLRHRQKLARMVLENQWYEQAERTKQDGFFKDLPSPDTKTKICRLFHDLGCSRGAGFPVVRDFLLSAAAIYVPSRYQLEC